MSKLKLALQLLLCLALTSKIHAQVGIASHQIYYNGSGNYPGIVRFEITTNQNTLTRTFSSPGVFPIAVTNPIQTISISIYKYSTNSNPIMGPIVSSYYTWLNNNLVINEPHAVYLDNHNNQNWYFYIEKLNTTDFRYWIGN